jgi:hypothetical protein
MDVITPVGKYPKFVIPAQAGIQRSVVDTGIWHMFDENNPPSGCRPLQQLSPSEIEN